MRCSMNIAGGTRRIGDRKLNRQRVLHDALTMLLDGRDQSRWQNKRQANSVTDVEAGFLAGLLDEAHNITAWPSRSSSG